MTSPSPLRLDFGFSLRRDGSTGSGRSLCRSPSAQKRPVSTARGQASSNPRQRPVTSSLFSTLCLNFETERNGNREGTKSQIVGITLFDDEDIAKLGTIAGGNLWNEESNEASKSTSQEETPKAENELELPPTPPPKDTLKKEERVKPEPRGPHDMTTSPLATREAQLQTIAEK